MAAPADDTTPKNVARSQFSVTARGPTIGHERVKHRLRTQYLGVVSRLLHAVRNLAGEIDGGATISCLQDKGVCHGKVINSRHGVSQCGRQRVAVLVPSVLRSHEGRGRLPCPLCCFSLWHMAWQLLWRLPHSVPCSINSGLNHRQLCRVCNVPNDLLACDLLVLRSHAGSLHSIPCTASLALIHLTGCQKLEGASRDASPKGAPVRGDSTAACPALCGACYGARGSAFSPRPYKKA